MNTDFSELMVALSDALGGEASVGSIAQSQDRTVIQWNFINHRGRPMLGRPPEISFDGSRYSWKRGGSQFSFDLHDLKVANPNRRDVESVASASALTMSDALRPYIEMIDPYALTAALTDRYPKLRLSFCALVVKILFPSEDFFCLRSVGGNSWRYKIVSGSARLEPPFTPTQLEDAERAVSEEAVTDVVDDICATALGGGGLFASDPAGIWMFLS